MMGIELKRLQLDVLRIVVEADRKRQVCPKIGVLATRLRLRNVIIVAFALRELEALGLLVGAPACGGTTTLYCEPTDAGRDFVVDWERGVGRLLESGGSEMPPRVVAYVPVTELRWRCLECTAATVDPSKPCALCAIYASKAPTPVWFEPKQGAA